MGEALDAAVNFGVDPAIVNNGSKVIFSDEFVADVIKFDAHIFEVVMRSAEVEVFEIKAGKPGSFVGEGAVEDKFYEFK